MMILLIFFKLKICVLIFFLDNIKGYAVSILAAVQKRSSMLFHHLYDESTDSNAKSEVIGLLQEICTEVGDDIQKSTPIRFGELISKMKRLDTNHMMQVYQAVNGGRICSSLRGK